MRAHNIDYRASNAKETVYDASFRSSLDGVRLKRLSDKAVGWFLTFADRDFDTRMFSIRVYPLVIFPVWSHDLVWTTAQVTAEPVNFR